MKKRKTREEKIKLQLRRLKERIREAETVTWEGAKSSLSHPLFEPGQGTRVERNFSEANGSDEAGVDASTGELGWRKSDERLTMTNYSYVFSDLKRTALFFLLAMGLLLISYLTIEAGYDSVFLRIFNRS